MSKKIILSEQEKIEIKNLYGILEQNTNNFFYDVLSDLFFGTGSDDEKKDTTDLSNISEKGQKLLNNELFKKRLTEISEQIGVDEDSIINLMKHESNLDPTVENSIGCVGLIQFCPDSSRGSYKTINGTRYNLEEIKNNLDLQMDAIENMWVNAKRKGKINSAEDLYIYNFFPIAAGQSDNFVLKSRDLSATTVARANPIYNKTLGKNISEPLTVGDLKQYYKIKGMT